MLLLILRERSIDAAAAAGLSCGPGIGPESGASLSACGAADTTTARYVQIRSQP